jgi:hypothetical protein
MAEKKQNFLRKILPNIILVIVLISSVLIILDVLANISLENESQNDYQDILQSTPEPTQGPRPTFPPDYTPPPINDA